MREGASMSFDTTSRFLRPTDLQRLRRNQRRIQVQRLLVVLRSIALLAVVVLGGVWIWRHTRSDERFAVRTIELAGVKHTPKAALDQVTQRYVGLNLFQIEIDRVQRDLTGPSTSLGAGLGWIRRIDIEKQVPDTLRIKITERIPVALVRISEKLLYVDEEGAAFAELSPRVGDADLPLIADAQGAELVRSVQLLTALAQRDPEVYSRISEVWPIAPRGFALFDRQLGAVVYANAEDISTKYRNLYAVLRAENNPKIEYADLRFADRVIVKGLETSNVQD